MTDPRAELLAGRRLRVTLRPGDGGLVYLRTGQFVYDCREGWAEGVVEAICFTDSDYIVGWLDRCERIDVDLGEWVPIKREAAKRKLRPRHRVREVESNPPTLEPGE